MWYEIGNGPNLLEWLVMVIPMILIWGALAWGVLALLRSPRFKASHMILGRSEPEEILARRFAGGEIDEAEFDRRMAVLHDSSRRVGGLR